MEHHDIHGHDVASFGTPLTHRVLTVSAADADAALLSQSSASSTASEPAPSSAQFVSTGIETLDAILSGAPFPDPDDDSEPIDQEKVPEDDPSLAGKQQGGGQQQASTTMADSKRHRKAAGGVRRGQLTEVWGPSGGGKTALGMQLVANALRSGRSVVWVDCFHSLCKERLVAMIDSQVGQADHPKSIDEGFVHYVCPSLPHFIASLCPPAPASAMCLPEDTSLLVIDSLSALVNYALPRTVDKKGTPLMANGKKGPAPYEKRTQVLQYITAALERLSETHNIAVVLLTQCASRVQAEYGAALVPALNAVVWDRGITTRLVLFRDWAWKDGQPIGGRFAGIQKLNGTGSHTAIDHAVAFSITEAGLVEEHYTYMPPSRNLYAQKRKLRDTGLDGGSDDDYGWDDDDSMPKMPPQWQGSEDLMLGNNGYEDEEGDEEEDGDAEGVLGQEDDATDKIRGYEQEENHLVPSSRESNKERNYDIRRRSDSIADSEEDSDM